MGKGRNSVESLKVSFYEHTNFRELLRDLIKLRKIEGKVFSFRWFSQKAGYSSPNFLKLVIEGQRNLTPDGIERLSQVFKFSTKQKTFFRILVQFNQAKTPESKESLVNDLMNFVGPKGTALLKKSQYNYYAKWYYIPIRELIVSSTESLTVEEISQRLSPSLTLAQVEEAIKALLGLELITQQQGRYQGTEKILSTGDEISMLAVTQYHLNMLRLAGESMSRFHSSEREISSVTLSLTPEKALEAKKMIQDFRKKLWALETKEGKKEVYQINFQLFPMTTSKRKGAK